MKADEAGSLRKRDDYVVELTENTRRLENRLAEAEGLLRLVERDPLRHLAAIRSHLCELDANPDWGAV